MSKISYCTCVSAFAMSAALALAYQSKTLDRSPAKPLVGRQPAQTDAPLRRGASGSPISIPMTFEPTVAQAPATVQFVGRGKGLAVALTRDGIELNAGQGSRERSAIASLRFARGHLVWRGTGRVPAESNYFLGNDPRTWRTHVPHFARAQASADGIGIVVYGNEAGLEYDLRLRPRADVSKLRLMLTGATGVHLDPKGDIAMRVGTSEFRMKKPAIFEEKQDSLARRIDGGYVLDADGTIGFRVLRRDPRAALVIDPSISVAFSSFLGGAGSDTASSVAVDSTGKIYIGGTTTSPASFPEAATAQIGLGIGSGGAGAAEFFIAKIDPTKTGANSLVYLTFLGGSANQAGGLIAVDSKGDVAITGTTTSNDFPVFPSADTSARTSGSNDTTVSEIDPTGAKLLYSTIFGGNGAESSQSPGGIAIDKAGGIFVASDTKSTDLPVTTGAYEQTYQSPTTDGFLAVFEPSTTLHLKYCTYLGLNGQVGVGGVAVDASGSVYIAGFTSDPSADFPSKNALQQAYGGGAFDAFLMKISPNGGGASDLIYATLLGGSGSDQAFAVAVDSATPPNAYVTGATNSTNFPTNGTVASYQASLPANATSLTSNAFLTVVAQSTLGVPSLAYSTYLGGSQSDAGQGIAVAAPFAVYVTGTANSWDFPWHDNFQPFNGYGDAFVTKLDTTSSGAASLIYSTPLGGTSPPGANASAQGGAVALDPAGNIWAVGQTTSADFPSAGNPGNGFQPICGSCQQSPALTDAFVVEIQENATQQLPSLYFAASSMPLNFGKQPLGSLNVPPQFAAVKNGGEAPLQISSVGITGPNSADFALLQPVSCAGATISSAGMCSFEVSFTPSVVGSEAAFVQFQDAAPGNPQLLELVGVGVGLTALPASLNFGKQPANTMSNPQNATLTNTASDPIFIDSVQETGANAAMFSPNNNATACHNQETLMSGNSCQISYEFAPTSAGTFQAEVEIQYHIQGLSEQEQIIPLSGMGVPPVPIASVAPVTLNFGTVSVGATAQTQGVTLTNTGSAALNVTTISITGTNASEFSLVASGNTPCPTSSGSVPVGGVCTMGVSFAPKTPGTKSATLSFADNAAGSPQTVALSGTAQTTAIQIAPATLTFTGQSVGTKSAPQPITATNAGTRALAINGITISGSNPGDFAQTNNCPPSLGASATCTVNVAFQPTATGARGASVSIADDAPNSPQTVAVTGTGTQAAVTLTPSSIAFGDEFKGTPTAAQPVTLTNTGSGALVVTAATLSDTADFTVTNNCAASVAQAATCTVTVIFNPATDGAISGTLTLTDNTPTSPQTIALSGTGIEFSLGPMQSGGTKQTATAGQTVTYQLDAQSTAKTPYTVTLACSAPSAIPCTVPANVMAGGTNSGQFSVSVTAPTAATTLLPVGSDRDPKEPRNHHPRQPQVAFVYAGLIASLLCFSGSRKQGVATRAVLARTVLLVALALTLGSCGGGATYDPPPQPQSYSISVTAKAAGGSQSLTLTLTVQP